jgi:hypothetical protein
MVENVHVRIQVKGGEGRGRFTMGKTTHFHELVILNIGILLLTEKSP